MWWPDRPRDVGLNGGGDGLAAELVFPSGRAAIAQALAGFDLPSNAAIALEPFASECLTRVVRRYGTPVAIGEAAAAAVVVYEQWGWPFTDTAWAELGERFKSRPILLDRVDSADFFARPRCSVEVLSLSKLLGLAGAGLLRVNGSLTAFEARPATSVIARLRTRPMDELDRPGYKELFKESRQAVHPAALAWLERNCLTRAAEEERAARQRNLQLILKSRLSREWPTWMGEAIGAGAGPVWAPILRGRDAARIWGVMATMEKRFGAISGMRPFNWSGNPLRPQYELCLALPVHSGVANFGEIVAALV